MKRHVTICLMVWTLFVLGQGSSWAKYDPSWKWKTHQSDHFTLYYPEGHEGFAQRVLALEDEVYNDVTGYLGVTPPHCPIVLNPGTDIFNGFYSPFPNRISLYETPYSSLRGFGPSSDMMDAVFTHEFSHFAHITTRLGWYGKISPLFGRDSSITNILSPGWIIEGITTNAETRFTDGGRGRCSYFKGEMMSFTEDEGLWNISAAGTYSPYGPPEGRFYLSGYHMVDYLNRAYGDDAFARLSRYQAMHPLGLTGEALENVTGASSSVFYQGFLDDLMKKTQAVKAQAESVKLPKGRVLFGDKHSDIMDHFWTDKNTILALRTGYDKKNAIIEIDPRSGEIIAETETGRINALHRISDMGDNENIIYAGAYPHLLGEGDLSSTDITYFNMKTRKTKRLTHDAHIFSAAPSHDRLRIVAVQRNGMWNDLVLFDSFDNNPVSLISKPGYLFESPSFSPDDRTIVCVVKTGQNADIALVNVETGSMRTLFKSDAFEDNDPCFSADGKYILFSSNRSGVWNIFAWDLFQNKLYQLTSVNYGATSPKLSLNGRTLSYLELHRGVRRLTTLPLDPEMEKSSVGAGTTTVPEPDLSRLTPSRTLDPKPMDLKVYTPFLHIPYVISDDEESRAGLYVLGSDPVGINSYAAFLDYGMSSKHAGYDIRMTNRSFWPDLMFGIYNKADELSISGEDFWLEEQGIELSTGFNMIHSVVPDALSSRLNLGLRYKWIDSLSSRLIINKGSNEATSIFGEWLIKHYPDAPARDVLPTWGQDVMLIHERTRSELNSEISARDTVISVTQYLPSFIAHHGFSLKGVSQKQEGELSFDKDYSLPRGYSESDREGGLDLSNNLLLSLEYHFPIAYPDTGLGLSVLHFHKLKSSLFSDFGAGWDGSFSASNWASDAQKVIGGSFRTEATMFSTLPVELGIEMGYKLDEKEGFTNLILLLGL